MFATVFSQRRHWRHASLPLWVIRMSGVTPVTLNNTYCSAVRFQVCRHAVHCDYILTFIADSKTFVMLFLKTPHGDFPLGSVPWTPKCRTAVFNHTPAMLATSQICLSHLSLDRTTCEVSRLSHFPLRSSRFQSQLQSKHWGTLFKCARHNKGGGCRC